MDSWNETQLRPMRYGGNGPARDWFRRYNIAAISNKTTKYGTSAAQAYKDKLKTISTGGQWQEITEEEMAKKYKAIANFGFGGFSSSGPGNFYESEDKKNFDSWLDGARQPARNNNVRRGATSSPATRGRAAPVPKKPAPPEDDLDEFFDVGPKVVAPPVDDEEDIWGFVVTKQVPVEGEKEAEPVVAENEEVAPEPAFVVAAPVQEDITPFQGEPVMQTGGELEGQETEPQVTLVVVQ
jgi:hypothetical protein